MSTILHTYLPKSVSNSFRWRVECTSLARLSSALSSSLESSVTLSCDLTNGRNICKYKEKNREREVESQNRGPHELTISLLLERNGDKKKIKRN